MTSIRDAISRIWPKNFKRLYLKNKRLFSGTFITYLKSITNSKAFAKKVESASLSICEIIDTEKKWLLKRLIDLASEHLLVINVFTKIQTLMKSTPSNYYVIFPWIWDK